MLRVDLFTECIGELGQQFALAFIESSRRFDRNSNQLVPPAVAVEVGDATTAQSENTSRLGSFLDFHRDRSLDGRDFEFGAQRGLREGDGDLAQDIVPLAAEQVVFLDLNDHKEISGGTSGSRFAFAAQFQTCAVVHAAGDFDFKRLIFAHLTRAATGIARVLDNGAATVAGRTGFRDREEPLLKTDLAGTSARPTGDGFGSVLPAGAVAGFAIDMTRDFDGFLDAETRFFKRDLQ